ncbi:MAG: hypothetical protein JSV78_14650 [Phycisphaerales bacterium]|nr:MAG: hypothetical protein JSV78_14650 [Phycisphaerales bacterium]
MKGRIFPANSGWWRYVLCAVVAVVPAGSSAFAADRVVLGEEFTNTG